MLTLSRSVGQRIIIGTGERAIVVTVTQIERGKVGIGIQAPKDVVILREELVGGDHDRTN